MCTWISEQTAIRAHGKGVAEWIALNRANVYYDHPVSAPLDHALIIDFVDASQAPGARPFRLARGSRALTTRAVVS